MKKIKFGIIGGGSIFSPELVELIAKESEIFQSVHISMMDIDKERMEAVGGLCERIISRLKAPITIEYVENYEQAIVDSDFVLIQFRVGGEDARIDDEYLGKKYQIPFVETVTVCGIATFLRTYYELEKIAVIIKEKAPKAWVLNFSNPAGMCSEALSILGISRVVGVCNASTRLLQFLTEKLGFTSDDNCFMNWRGLNHLTAVDSIMVNGEEAYSRLIDSLEDFESDRIPFEKELVKQIGFLPNQYFQYHYRKNGMIEKLQKAEKVRSVIVKEINAALIDTYRDIDYVPEGLEKRGGSGYSTTVIGVIKSFYTGDNKIHYLVTRNNGAITELPDDSYVECPCSIGMNIVSPLACGSLPKTAAAVIVPMKMYETLLIDAARTRNRSKLYQAMMAHPLLGDHTLVTDLMAEILVNNRHYLPTELIGSKE